MEVLTVTDGRQASPAVELLRTQRLEVVDQYGRPYLVAGDLGSPDPERSVLGLALLDANGRQRVWLALDGTGPNMVFDLAGNGVLTFGVNDPAPDALHVGAYCWVSDVGGSNVLGWRVEQDGAVWMRLGGPTR
jgi:hypothetical protein